MFRRHRLATAVGAAGAATVLAHVALGPAVMPVRGAFAGLLLVAAAGLYLVIAQRLEPARNDRRPDRRQLK